MTNFTRILVILLKLSLSKLLKDNMRAKTGHWLSFDYGFHSKEWFSLDPCHATSLKNNAFPQFLPRKEKLA